MKIYLTGLFIIMVLISGCISRDISSYINDTSPATIIHSAYYDDRNMHLNSSMYLNGFQVTVIHYDSYNVSCFVMDTSSGGGISCLSDYYVNGV